MFKYFGLVAVLAILSQTNAQNLPEGIYDNVGNFADYVFDKIYTGYQQQNGTIKVPNYQALSDGSISDLTQIKRIENTWVYADPADFNPRNVSIHFALESSKVHYDTYRISAFLPNRKVDYELNNLHFTVDFAIQVTQSICSLLIESVKVEGGDVHNAKTEGGIIQGVNGALASLATASKRTVVKAIEKDVQQKLDEALGNGEFDCLQYGPSQLFGHKLPQQPQQPEQQQPQQQ